MRKTSRGLSTVPPRGELVTQAAIYSHRADYSLIIDEVDAGSVPFLYRTTSPHTADIPRSSEGNNCVVHTACRTRRVNYITTYR